MLFFFVIPLPHAAASACRKSPPAASFSEYLHCFPLGSMSLPGGKQCKETLLRKASESAAHVAGFGLHLEGCGPPNLPEGFFDSLPGLSSPIVRDGAPVSGYFVRMRGLGEVARRRAMRYNERQKA